MPEPPTHTAVCQTTLAGQGTTLKITLTPKFLAKPLLAALIKPFIGAVNKKLGTATKLEDVERVSVDGTEVDLTTGVAGDVLPCELHHVEILLKPTAVDVSDSSKNNPAASAKSAGSSPGSSSSDPVERVCAAANEFELLELPLEAASSAAVRKSYRRISLLVHPDKVSHPRASEAFRKAFDAMQCLMDQKRQAVFEADRERLGSVPLPTLRERRAVVSYEALSVRGLVARYGDVRDCAHLLPSRKRKRAKLSEAQVQMVQSGAAWNAVQKADAVAGAKRKGGAGGEEMIRSGWSF